MGQEEGGPRPYLYDFHGIERHCLLNCTQGRCKELRRELLPAQQELHMLVEGGKLHPSHFLQSLESHNHGCTWTHIAGQAQPRPALDKLTYPASRYLQRLKRLAARHIFPRQ